MAKATVCGKPLTREETKQLLNLIENSKIINNRATNQTNNKIKNEEWMRIADAFNAVVTSAYRTPQQLRLKWENLKKNARKRNTAIRMNNIKTGGGGPDYIPPDDISDRVSALLGSTVDGFVVAHGGDAEPMVEPATVIISDGETLRDMESVDAAMVTSDVAVEEFLLQDSGHCSTIPPKQKTLFTPRASGYNRKQKIDHRARRNQAIAEYYTVKSKLLEANFENVMLENKRLKLEIEKLQNS